LIQRLAQTQAGAIGAGINPSQATDFSYKVMDLAVTKQGFLLAYSDCFQLLSLFFICAIPFMFLLRTKKMDKATMQKVAEESH
jgi:DHA2 family multidrug resistance protein